MEQTILDNFNKPSIEYLKHAMLAILDDLNFIDKVVEIHSLGNEQFVLNFYDELNKIRVKR